VAIGAVALAASACLAGFLTTGLRLAAAGLSPGHGLFVVPAWDSIRTGLVLASVAVGTLVVSCVAAFAVASRRWDAHGDDWADIVQHGFGGAWTYLHVGPDAGQRQAARTARFRAARYRRRARRRRTLVRLSHAARLTNEVPEHDPAVVALEGAAGQQAAGQHAPAPDRLLRILAGFNLIVLSGAIGLGVGQAVAEFQSAWWAVVPAGLAAFLLVHWVLTTLGPLAARPHAHVAAWILVGALALLSSPPVGVLVITGVIISTWGRRFVQAKASEPVARTLMSPLPWLMAVLYTAVAVGYLAMPPVSFDGARVMTASAEFVGGKLEQSSAGIHLLICTPLADATSTGAYIRDLRRPPKVTPAGDAALDSGERPSLLALGLNVVGINWPRAVFAPSLHARKPTCANAPPETLSVGTEDPALGQGAIVGPAPPAGSAVDGEKPIEQTTDARIARLARRYQPTIEVTVADPFWPVSVGALLQDVGLGGNRTCLFTATGCGAITSVPASGQPTDYLRFPTTRDLAHSALTSTPWPQFDAFLGGQGTSAGSLHHWLADPGLLDPWRTAEVYFYYAGPLHFTGIANRLPAWPTVDSAAVPAPADAASTSDGLIGLQYWFYYPYNYYPLVVRSSLMRGAPIAGDVKNVDLHQGDWEHVTVLLDERTLQPVYLYMARHANEGQFYPWNSRSLAFDGSHPIVQAAIGGHPTYPNSCGAHTRKPGFGLLKDWVVCGSGRFAFRAATTPLVDLAQTGWACWPGRFGEAKLGREVAKLNADTFTSLITKYVHVAGPRSPLRQAENGFDPPGHGVCDRRAGYAESAALVGPFAALLGRLYGARPITKVR
jgi:hypothetical protein